MSRNRVSVLALLAGWTHDYVRLARPLLRALEETRHFHIDVLTDPEGFALDDTQVLLAASDHHLQPGQAAQLTDFVRGGGGLVLLPGPPRTWAGPATLADPARWARAAPAPLSEFAVGADPSHPLTQRLGPD